jgi:hypothetical protein
MRVLLATLIFGLMMTTADAVAVKITKAQAEKQCRTELDSFDGEKRRSRTGYSLAQDMAFCIKQKTAKHLGK